MKKNTSASDESLQHDQSFDAAFVALNKARTRRVKMRPHRAITPLKLTPYLLAQALTLPILFCGLVYWAKPMLMEFWRACILYWSARIALPFSLSSQLNEAGQFALELSSHNDGSLGNPMPTNLTLTVTALLVLLGLAISLRMKKASLPLKYPLRIVCVVQLVTLIYFWALPNSFPYSIARHSEELMTIGYVLMLASPMMLAVGYYILNQSLFVKILHTALILCFFLIMVPHQVLAQAFILQHLSVLFMPVMYICMGAVFDALVFVALYSWVASNAPANATV